MKKIIALVLALVTLCSCAFVLASGQPEEELIGRISAHFERFWNELSLLEGNLEKYPQTGTATDKAFFAKDVLLANIECLRHNADSMELLIGKEFMPYPTYEDILYSVKY